MNYPMMLIAGLTIACTSCDEKNPPAENAKTSAAQDSTETPQPYFPVASFLKSEISYVDSLPVGIKKYTSSGAKLDSAYITPEEFHRLTSEFVTAELEEKKFAADFRETSFLDRATNSATFFYAAKNPANKLKRVDVVTIKGDIYDDVRSLYIEKNEIKGDTSIVKKLMWKPQRNFQIISITTINGQKPKNELVKVVWDNRD
jgi:hypothetical protein